MTDQLHHLAAAYALDALDIDERRAFEAHYPTCDICSREVVEFRETAAVLAEQSQAMPSPELKDRIRDEVSRTRQLSPLLPESVVRLSTRRPWRTTLLMGAAAAVILVIGGVLGALLNSSRTDDIDAVLAAPDAVVSSLDGDRGSLQVVWSPDRSQVVVFGNDVPAPGPAQTYELWFLLDEGVAPAGLFDPDDGRVRVLLDVDDLDGRGWGVTIEPEGGSEMPTSDIVFVGEI